MTRLSVLLAQALCQTMFRADGDVLLTATEVRSRWKEFYWGAPDAETVRSVWPQVPDPSVESISAYLRRRVPDYIHAGRDCIGHSFGVLGERYGSTTAVDHHIRHQGVSTVTGFARGLVITAALLGPERVARLVDDWSRDAPLRPRICVLVGGGLYPEAPLELVHGLRVYSLPVSSDSFPRSIPEMQSLSVPSWLGQTVLEVDAEMRPALFRPGNADDELPELETRVALGPVPLEIFLLALSLVCNRRLGLAWAWADYGELEAFSRGRSHGLLGPGRVQVERLRGTLSYSSSGDVCRLTDYQAPVPNLSAGRLWRAWEIAEELHRRVSSNLRFQIAVTRWSRAALPGVVTPDRVVDLRIALESLFLDSDAGELVFRLSTTGARYLGSDLEERRAIRKTLREFYGLASRTIHGAAIGAPSQADMDLVDAASRLCRDGILKNLTDRPHANWADFLLS